MSVRSRPTWSDYRNSIGDRSELFHAINKAWAPTRALYLGSYVDLSPSVALPAVTYVDTDRRAARFFADQELVARELREARRPGEDELAGESVTFLHADFSEPLGLEPATFDLLISLYTGPVWDRAAEYLQPGGLFLANNSHGDASLAALDERLDLIAVVTARGDQYRLHDDDLQSHLLPKNPERFNVDVVRSSGRGVAFTRLAFAYVFRYSPELP